MYLLMVVELTHSTIIGYKMTSVIQFIQTICDIWIEQQGIVSLKSIKSTSTPHTEWQSGHTSGLKYQVYGNFVHLTQMKRDYRDDLNANCRNAKFFICVRQLMIRCFEPTSKLTKNNTISPCRQLINSNDCQMQARDHWQMHYIIAVIFRNNFENFEHFSK